MWTHGDLVIRREVLGFSPIDPPAELPPWHERAWLELPVYVVEDTPEQLVTYIATGAEFKFPDGRWPAPGGLHPWRASQGWQGNGCLMIQRPDDHYAVWHFWEGSERRFSSWYLNMQTAFRRTDLGYDTQDLEVDFVIGPDGDRTLKDYEVLDERVAEGRFSAELVDWIRGYTAKMTNTLDNDVPWWDPAWAQWRPPDDWVHPTIQDAMPS